MTLADIISFATYLGLTPSGIFPLILLGGAIAWIGYRYISPIGKSVRRITNACIEIQTIMGNDGVTLHHHLVEAPGSPLRPTLYGQKLIKESGLEEILDENKASFIAELKKLLTSVHTEYDVQEKARDFLVSEKDHPVMVPVKEYAYSKGLNVDVILKAGGLWLRDDFLGQARRAEKED
jgi:hypothetical protein